MAVDVTGFPLANSDVELLVTRARIDAFIPQSKDVDETEGQFCKPSVRVHHLASHQVSGFSIAAGNPLMARIYDKTAELSLPGREGKRDIETATWRANGWDGDSDVTRVEFQHRGEYLDEVNQRDVASLETNIDAIWQRDVLWLRLVRRETATRLTRCALDPRWGTISEVVFSHTAQPIDRQRVRRGATPEHALGATLSRLAAAGRISPIAVGTTDDGELLNEITFAKRMSPDQAVAWLRHHLALIYGEAARDIAQSLLRHRDPREAVTRFLSKHNATIARLSSADDEPAHGSTL